MIIFFSGTGNSRFVAEYLANELQEEIVDASKLMKTGEKGKFVSDKPFVVISPIYSWRMPRVFEDFLRNSEFFGSDEVYFVMTCGGDMGAAGNYNEKLCEEKKLIYCGSMEVVMPDNYIIMFSAPGPDDAEKIVRNSIPMLEQGAQMIRQGETFPAKICNFVDKVKSGVVNDGFNKYFVKSKGFWATDKCVNCGKCTEVCVLNNITLDDGKPVWGNDCTQCMACICGCPMEAIEYGKKTAGKVRYQCPQVLDD